MIENLCIGTLFKHIRLSFLTHGENYKTDTIGNLYNKIIKCVSDDFWQFHNKSSKKYLFHGGCGVSDMVMMCYQCGLCYQCGRGQDDDTVEIHTNVVLLSGSPSLFWPIFTHQRHSADTSPRREDTAGILKRLQRNRCPFQGNG